MHDFEKLGAFYLGRVVDPGDPAGASGAAASAPLLYDSRDLTTHAVCVGMTGSGKTGLCLALLEEAAIDGIPAIAIDPKGDLGNLMLAFPDLRPADFRPWVDEGEAARAGLDPDAFAARTAETWRAGLAEWGQDPSRIARFRDAADVAIYTPGSSAGLPLSVLRSLSAPPVALRDDTDLLRERVAATVSGLLALLGIEADPIRSREHILLSNLLEHSWRDGRDLELGGLVRLLQTPPFDRVGVMDLESFYPAKDRAALAVQLNGLLASPGFAAWLEGEPLDVKRLLYTDTGRPRISILSIAHLSDPERMFFVTLLLNEVLAWVRTQPGTSSLRAILYMDEVFGFFPPTANPPSKTPMLTLLKQARAYGLGVVLATQNPVDLDYKGLSNAGTWFLGRLQTERDKARVIEGLEGAATTSGGRFDRQTTEALLAGLKSRMFLMSNAHDDAPVLFQSRWALSYLRGPLTRVQIQTLMTERRKEARAEAPSDALPASASRPSDASSPATAPPSPAAQRPVLPPDVPEQFLLPAGGVAPGTPLAPALLATVRLHYADAKSGVDQWDKVVVRQPLAENLPANIWDGATVALGDEPPIAGEAPPGAQFAPLPAAAMRARSYATWEKALANHLYQNRPLVLRRCAELKMTSRPDEAAGEFAVRVRDQARARRDAEVEKLRARYAPRLAALTERLRRAEQRVGREQAQFQQQTMQTAISVGATVLGALFGRKVASAGTIGRATTAMRGAGRTAREHGDIGEAQETVAAVRALIAGLESECNAEVARLQASPEPVVVENSLRLRKSDTGIDRLVLVWCPVP